MPNFMVITLRKSDNAPRVLTASAESTADVVEHFETLWSAGPETEEGEGELGAAWVVPIHEALSLPIANWKVKRSRGPLTE